MRSAVDSSNLQPTAYAGTTHMDTCKASELTTGACGLSPAPTGIALTAAGW